MLAGVVRVSMTHELAHTIQLSVTSVATRGPSKRLVERKQRKKSKLPNPIIERDTPSTAAPQYAIAVTGQFVAAHEVGSKLVVDLFWPPGTDPFEHSREHRVFLRQLSYLSCVCKSFWRVLKQQHVRHRRTLSIRRRQWQAAEQIRIAHLSSWSVNELVVVLSKQ